MSVPPLAQIGNYALSIKYREDVHHFPIILTADKRYNIGEHDFCTLFNVVIYFKRSTLFVDETGRSVSLGQPFVISQAAKI